MAPTFVFISQAGHVFTGRRLSAAPCFASAPTDLVEHGILYRMRGLGGPRYGSVILVTTHWEADHRHPTARALIVVPRPQ